MLTKLASFRHAILLVVIGASLASCTAGDVRGRRSVVRTPTSLETFDLSLGKNVNNLMHTELQADGSLKLSTNFNYSTLSTPALTGDWARAVAYDPVNDLIFVHISSAGINVIDTQSTASPADDVILRTFTTLTTPALPSNSLNRLWYDSARGHLYASGNAGVTVISTGGNTNNADDSLVKTYNTASTPATADNFPYGVKVESNGLLYISGYTAGLTVIDTNNTASAADDTQVFIYNTTSSPALSSNRVMSTRYDAVTEMLYVDTGGGLNVIDTQGTKTAADDVLVATYNDVSTPAIAGPWTMNSFIDPVSGLLYIASYITGGGGLSVIDLAGTTTQADDSLWAKYNLTSTIKLRSTGVHSAWRESATTSTFVSTWSGLHVIDDQGTSTMADDSLTIWGSKNKLPYNESLGSMWLANLQSYLVWSTAGLTLIGPGYNTSGAFLSAPQDLPQGLNDIGIYWSETAPSGTNVSVETRTGDYAFVDNFDNGVAANVVDAGEGSMFPSVVEAGGIVTLSGVPADTTFAAFNIDTGQAANYFPAGSHIVARVRVQSANTYNDNLVIDGWEDRAETYFPSGGWEIVTLTATTPFSTVGFQPRFTGAGWQPGDTFEIDYVKIIRPADFGAWSSAITSGGGTSISSDITKQAIQLRLNLSSPSSAVAPTVSNIFLYDAEDFASP